LSTDYAQTCISAVCRHCRLWCRYSVYIVVSAVMRSLKSIAWSRAVRIWTIKIGFDPAANLIRIQSIKIRFDPNSVRESVRTLLDGGWPQSCKPLNSHISPMVWLIFSNVSMMMHINTLNSTGLNKVLFVGHTLVCQRTHWHLAPLANTIEPSMCGGDAVYCHVILTTGYYGYVIAYVIGQAIKFFAVVSSFFCFSSPNLSRRRLDVYHIYTHGVALVRI